MCTERYNVQANALEVFVGSSALEVFVGSNALEVFVGSRRLLSRRVKLGYLQSFISSHPTHKHFHLNNLKEQKDGPG
jgi:hypothetical protein